MHLNGQKPSVKWSPDSKTRCDAMRLETRVFEDRSLTEYKIWILIKTQFGADRREPGLEGDNLSSNYVLCLWGLI